MVPPPMAVRELHRLPAERQPEQLVAEADPKDRECAVRQIAQRGDRVGHRRRISRPIREEQTVGRELADAGRRCGGWDDGDAAAVRSEEHTSELQSQSNLVCRLLLEKKKKQ